MLLIEGVRGDGLLDAEEVKAHIEMRMNGPTA